MKTTYLMLALTIIGLSACNTKPGGIKVFIPGTYVNAAKGDYSQAEDTLIITALNDNVYLITRNITYQAIRDGRVLRKHHKTQKLNALYDPQKQVLNEITNGCIFTFDPDKKLLKINQAIYHKL